MILDKWEDSIKHFRHQFLHINEGSEWVGSEWVHHIGSTAHPIKRWFGAPLSSVRCNSNFCFFTNFSHQEKRDYIIE